MQPATPIWSVRPPATEEEVARFAPLTPLAAQVLINRGLSDSAAAEEFLNPDYRHLADPLLMKGMEVAAGRIAQALDAGEPITVCESVAAKSPPATDFEIPKSSTLTRAVSSCRRVTNRFCGLRSRWMMPSAWA